MKRVKARSILSCLVATCLASPLASRDGLLAAGVGAAVGSRSPLDDASDLESAETILLYQRENGGWPKNYDRRRKLAEKDRERVLSEKSRDDTTFDNGATHSELKFLARIYRKTKDERFRSAFIRGLEFTLAAQYENGGWPQRHPRRSGYHAHITFNDGAMVGVLEVLTSIARQEPGYEFLEDSFRRRCREAVERGVQCLLRCQIEVDGKKTAWCAQHDAKNYSPRGARSYELPSISGSESVGVVRYLMGIANPSPAVLAGIEAAVAWFEKSKLTGIRVEKREVEGAPGGRDKIVVEDPAAPPLWARFYEIGSDKPIFCSRDGKPKETLAEISHERRNGYSWLTNRPAELLKSDYPAWKQSVRWGLRATGHDSRIDLRWRRSPLSDGAEFNVYRSVDGRAPLVLVNETPHKEHVYSDFLGENGSERFYRVTRVLDDGEESEPSPVVSSSSRAMSDAQLLSSVQEATFRYFWDHGHPVSGLARERLGSGDTCTTGGSGFGLMAMMVGADRGFVPRQQVAARILRVLTFLEEKAERYHGVWSHWLNGSTGETIPFASKKGVRADDGGDLVETSFLMQGILTIRQYFDRDDAVETEIRARATRMWRAIEWDWYLRYPGGKQLYWHWSENYGWMMDHAIGGHFNECMITYLLAIASPTHPIPASSYYEGWVGDTGEYANGKKYYGHELWVGRPMGGRMFFTHYSFLGFDPRGKRDRFCNYFENNRNIARIHRAYCEENPRRHEGYSSQVWGLTSCDTPDGYRGLDPHTRDNGTIAPTAAISSMPYTPEESLATLKHYYHELGDRLWGEYGFRDAFNPGRDWVAPSYLAIDQGPIVCMIENYRTGLCWRMFMSNPEVKPMLEKIGWESDDGE